MKYNKTSMPFAGGLICNKYTVNWKNVMFIKLVLDPQTLEISLEDSEITVNEIKTLENGHIAIELSKPDLDSDPDLDPTSYQITE